MPHKPEDQDDSANKPSATARALLEERHRAARIALSDFLAALGAPSGPALAAARERLAGVLTVFAR